MMRQLQEMQARMVAEQEALADETVEASVGGGVVTVVMNGRQMLTAVTIRPEILAPEEAEMLGDLVIAAVNQAVEKSQQMASERMGAITKGLNMPPGLGF
jgi:nucleoid-associated protein EbfC